MKNSTFLLLFIVLISSACSRYVAISSYNLNYQYIPEPTIKYDYKTIDVGEKIRVFMRFEVQKLQQQAQDVAQQLLLFQQNYQIIYRLTTSYQAKDAILIDTVHWENTQLHYENNGFLLHFDVPKIAKQEALLVVDLYETNLNENFIIDIPLPLESKMLYHQYLIYNANKKHPYYKNSVSIEDTLIIRRADGKETPLFIKHFAQSFSPSLPPMAVSSQNTNPILKENNKYISATGRYIVFAAEGLYWVQEDTNSKEGFGIVVTQNKKYPTPTKAEEMIEPLIYISTKEERKRMQNATNPKLALDQFWLNIGGSQDYARKLIRNYYTQVESANRLFTSYKEGWKTDMGMIYIVFGKPDKVNRFENYEQWHYEIEGKSNVLFTFQKVPTVFTPNNYELVRYSEYDKVWYTAVDNWRKGTWKR